MSASTAPLAELSLELSGLVARCSPGVVAVRLPRGRSISAIVWREGLIVTAAEALDERDTPLRVLSDTGAEHEAKLLGRDPGTDVALLGVAALSAKAFPAIDPAQLRPGQLALALGRSAEHGPIVALGTVAVAGAAWQSQLGGRIDRLIRVGASLTPAGEGGAVLDIEGRLVGMAVFGPRRTLLAIPAITLSRVAEQLLDRGRVARGYLGIAMQPVQLPEPLAQLANTTRGLLVSAVDPESCAARAGALLGDVIVAWNDSPVRDYRQLQRLLGPESVGSAVTLTVLRGGARAELRLTVGERPNLG
jgi:S1-C subfamily serine protease